MADKQAIRRRAINRLIEKYKQQVAWPQIVQAFQAANPAQKQAFIKAIYMNKPDVLQRRIHAIVTPYIEGIAVTRVNQILSDNSLSLDEFEELFG